MSLNRFITCIVCLLSLNSTFSYAEPNWNLQPVRVCVDPDWEPLEKLTDEGEFTGIAADLLNLVFARALLTFEVLQTADWNETLQKSQAGECDIVALLNKTEARSKWLNFTRPYLIDPNVIITRNEHPFVSSLQSLEGSRVVLPVGTSVYEWVKRDYPKITLIPVETEFEAFDLVDRGIADATLRALTVSAFTIRKEGWFNLKVAGEIQDYKNLLRIGVSQEHTELLTRLDQAVATLTEADINEAINRHINIAVNYHHDWALTFRIILIATLIVSVLILIGLFQFRAHRRLLKLKQALENSILEKDQVSARLKESELLYRSLLDTAHDGITVIQQGRLVYANPRLAEITGLTIEELKALPSFLELIPHDERDEILSKHHKRLKGEPVAQRYESHLINRAGDVIVIDVSGVCIDWYGQPATLNFICDITERKLAEKEIIHLANHDPLTGLANRRLLMDRLDQLVLQAQRYDQFVAVIFLDLNGFKPVNDTWGHETGDQLLQAVAKRLQNSIRQSDILARIGGDEFVVLIPQAKPETLLNMQQKLTQVITEPFELAHAAITISTSVGVAIFPEDGSSATELLRKADERMYTQKRGVY